jgi:hypothetical protein
MIKNLNTSILRAGVESETPGFARQKSVQVYELPLIAGAVARILKQTLRTVLLSSKVGSLLSTHSENIFYLEDGEICSSETLVTTDETTRCRRPECYNLNSHRRENLESRKKRSVLLFCR